MNKSYDYLFKIVLIGDSGVGKSSLLLRFADGAFTDSFISTIGVDFRFRTVEVEDKAVKLQIVPLDTAGQERFRTITSAYYRGADGILLVYDVSDKSSFEGVSPWLQEVRKYTSEDIKLCLIGNKSDLSSEREVSREAGQILAKEMGASFIETSAKNSDNVEESFIRMACDLVKRQQMRRLRETDQRRKAGETMNAVSYKSFMTFGKEGSCCP